MLWKNIDGCTGEPDTSKKYCETYSQCQGGVEVTLCSLPGTGHILYQNSLGFSVPDEAWAMFQRQPMK
jgi:polyhydroxybutyrate depolymerase